MTEGRNQGLDLLDALVGEWATVASNHRELPGVEAKGTASIEWLTEKQFLVVRSRSERPYPDSLTIVGIDEANEAFVGHIRAVSIGRMGWICATGCGRSGGTIGGSDG